MSWGLDKAEVYKGNRSEWPTDNYFHRYHLHNPALYRIEMCGEYTSWCHWHKANYMDPLFAGMKYNTCPGRVKTPCHCRPHTMVVSGHYKQHVCGCNLHCRSCDGNHWLNSRICRCKFQSPHRSHLSNLWRHYKAASKLGKRIHLYIERGRPSLCRWHPPPPWIG